MTVVGAELQASRNAVGRHLLPLGATLAIAAALFVVAYDGGSYGQVGRNSVAIGVWWAVIVGFVFGVWPPRAPRAALAVGGLLAAFALLTLASTTWATSAERAFADFDRASLYLGVFAVVVLAGRRSDLARWSDGVAIATTGIAILALTSRLLPDLVSSSDFRVLLPAAYSRLSYPLGYWNALAILIGIGVPLVLRSALAASSLVIRGLSLAAVPPTAAAIYFTSSRGGVATAILALLVFVAFTSRRVDALVALLCAAPGTGFAIAILLGSHELVNDPASSTAESQRASAALLVGVAALVTGVLYAAVCGRWPVVHLPRIAGRIMAAAAIGLLVVGVAAARPLDRIRTFKEPPPVLVASKNQDYVQAHLLSGNGSGRWQFWRSAVKEFESRPFFGRGGGSYEAWWAEHGTLNAYVRNAHSLYFETLGELGAAGFLLLCGAFAVGLIAALRRILRAAEGERLTVAALAAAFAGYVVAAGIDWIWELTAVSVVGFVLLGLLVGPASAFGRPRLVREEEREAPSRSRSFGLGIGVVVVAWLLICAHAIPLLSSIKIRDSQSAAAAGNPTGAVDDALAARNIQPWAATPYLQLALVTEEAGALPIARRWIDEAIKRDRTDWRLWLVAARLETNSGNIRAARRSLAHARQLNPRSPLFQSQPG